MRLGDVTSYLDEFLKIRTVADDPLALNGLQVDNGGEVGRIAVAVDACQAVIDEAVKREANLLIVHHGLFWSGVEPLTGRHYRRLTSLTRHDIALYSAHLPLDLHPEVGNNVLLARLIGMEVQGWWGEYMGAEIGVRGELDLPREALAGKLAGALGSVPPKLIPGGPARARRIGIISGAGGSMIEQAQRSGLDTFVTGEGKHHTYFDAEELGINVLYAGHYATETVGVKALGEHLGARFHLPWSFIDHPTGL